MTLLSSVHMTSAERGAFEARCFDAWMARVDAACLKLCGVSVHDLDDCLFHDWYDDGDTAEQAARRAIRRSGHGE